MPKWHSDASSVRCWYMVGGRRSHLFTVRLWKIRQHSGSIRPYLHWRLPSWVRMLQRHRDATAVRCWHVGCCRFRFLLTMRRRPVRRNCWSYRLNLYWHLPRWVRLRQRYLIA